MNLNKYYHAIHESTPVNVTIDPPATGVSRDASTTLLRSEASPTKPTVLRTSALASNETEQPRLSWRESFVYYMDGIRDHISNSIFWGPIVAVLALIILIYVAIVVICIIVIGYNIAIEATIVSLFGRNVYNKNFPVCTYTQYNGGNDCYTSTSTYCT